MSIKPLIAGNWKMNGLVASIDEFKAIQAQYDSSMAAAVDLLICPPVTLLWPIALLNERIELGAQDCHGEHSGAHTGDISATMIVDASAGTIIVGHSERRSDHAETDAVVLKKAQAALSAGAKVIICVGETQKQRESGEAVSAVLEQLKNSVPENATAATVTIAYEPVWAIGTGITPSAYDIAEIHSALRYAVSTRFDEEGKKMRLLYGGSVKPENAAELMRVANVNGSLVGGASLKAHEFIAIARVYA